VRPTFDFTRGKWSVVIRFSVKQCRTWCWSSRSCTALSRCDHRLDN